MHHQLDPNLLQDLVKRIRCFSACTCWLPPLLVRQAQLDSVFSLHHPYSSPRGHFFTALIFHPKLNALRRLTLDLFLFLRASHDYSLLRKAQVQQERILVQLAVHLRSTLPNSSSPLRARSTRTPQRFKTFGLHGPFLIPKSTCCCHCLVDWRT